MSAAKITGLALAGCLLGLSGCFAGGDAPRSVVRVPVGLGESPGGINLDDSSLFLRLRLDHDAEGTIEATFPDSSGNGDTTGPFGDNLEASFIVPFGRITKIEGLLFLNDGAFVEHFEGSRELVVDIEGDDVIIDLDVFLQPSVGEVFGNVIGDAADGSRVAFVDQETGVAFPAVPAEADATGGAFYQAPNLPLGRSLFAAVEDANLGLHRFCLDLIELTSETPSKPLNLDLAAAPDTSLCP